MKHLITTTLLALIASISFAQKTPTLKAETAVRKSSVVAETYPRITLNESKCRFDHLTVKPTKGEQYILTIAFARPCDEQNDFALTFSNLQEAILVKDLIMEDRDYDFFHLTSDNAGMSFEIVYPSLYNKDPKK